jgi:cytochrome c
MRKLVVLLICAVVTVTAAAAAPALAADTADLARSKNCMACHSIGNKVVGPAFKDVAKRYAGQPDAAEKLVQKVLKGGSGSWGVVPMPANTQVTEAEARMLVQWVLSLK